MILVGDIGATKVHLGLYRESDDGLCAVRDARFAVREFDGLDEVVRQFLGGATVSSAWFGVPGPLSEGRARMANLAWPVDGRALQNELDIQKVGIVNDLEATSYGLRQLTDGQLVTLNEGRSRPHGAVALIAAGTGLGESFLTWDGTAHVSHPSEGSHADFAPRNDDEFDLLRYLMRKYGGRVSVERVVSGLGLANIYEFLRDERRMEEPNWLTDELAVADDPNTVISTSANAGKSALCEKTLEIFVSAFGAEAGNLGLKSLSTGGIYIGGGIAPRILELLREVHFLRAFTDKGRLSYLLMEMPVHVIEDKDAALLGVKAYAEANCGDYFALK
jgi:glucokinase